MHCFYVLVHGALQWQVATGDAGEGGVLPKGFYCHRFVLAATPEEAETKAFRRVRANLDRQTGWLSAGTAVLELEAEEVSVAPMHKLLVPDNRGHTFYERA
jgi:hypothetical protein